MKSNHLSVVGPQEAVEPSQVPDLSGFSMRQTEAPEIDAADFVGGLSSGNMRLPQRMELALGLIKDGQQAFVQTRLGLDHGGLLAMPA